MKFKPITTAPIGSSPKDQILCRFRNTQFGYYVYFIAYPNGENTNTPGYAKPEEWCELEN